MVVRDIIRYVLVDLIHTAEPNLEFHFRMQFSEFLFFN